MKLGQKFGIRADNRKFAADTRFVLPECRIGIEQEWENAPYEARNHTFAGSEPWMGYWEWREEHSIRETGVEFCFREPLFGKDVYDALVGLSAYAIRNRWASTQRTGLHVHLDMRDLEVPQLIGFCTLYAIFEKALYRWIGDNREYNHFCLPWYKAEGNIAQASKIIRAVSMEASDLSTAQDAAETYARYAGLNLGSLGKFGSIEARQMKSTAEVERICTWINILQSLKAASIVLPRSDGAIINTVETIGPRVVGAEIFGKYFEQLDYPELEKDVLELGIPCAESLLRNGLESNLWAQIQYPKGVHSGFAKFLEKAKKNKKQEKVQQITRLIDVTGEEVPLAAPVIRGDAPARWHVNLPAGLFEVPVPDRAAPPARNPAPAPRPLRIPR